MRFVISLMLCVLLALIQTKLWWGEGSSIAYMHTLELQRDALQTQNGDMRFDNNQLRAELRDLRDGTEILEDQARSELGMIKPNEVLVLLR